MSGYRKKPDRIDDPGPLLGKLRTCREEVLRAALTVRPFGVTYHGLSMVVVAIDALGTLLSGQREYFAVSGSVAPEGQRSAEAEKMRAEGRASGAGNGT